MTVPTRPLLALYVAWHPSFAVGDAMAKSLMSHFRRELFDSVAGGTGLSVLFRSQAAPGEPCPLPIDPESAETTAVIVLGDGHMVGDQEWRRYVEGLSREAEARGLRMRVLPVAFERSATALTSEQAIRFDKFTGSSEAKTSKLVAELTLELCRMLRHYLVRLEHGDDSEKALNAYLEKVAIFLGRRLISGDP